MSKSQDWIQVYCSVGAYAYDLCPECLQELMNFLKKPATGGVDEDNKGFA